MGPQRTSEICAVTSVDTDESTAATVGRGGQTLAERRTGPPGLATRPAPYGLAQELRKVAAIPAADDVIDGALRLVVALARATVVGADGVSVSLRRHQRLSTIAASDHTVSEMDAGQYATGEGPCIDASVNGVHFLAESLDTELRWPAFTPRARALGIHSILSSPLIASDQPVGAINMYSRTAGAFAGKDRELASVFAAEASVILTNAGADVGADRLASRLGQALQAREVIALAQGVIMERHNVDKDGAYTALLEVSVRTGRPIREQAEDVIASTRWPLPELSSAALGRPDA